MADGSCNKIHIMSAPRVNVKVEPVSQSERETDTSETAAALSLLYAGHAVKDELVLGPEDLKRPATTVYTATSHKGKTIQDPVDGSGCSNGSQTHHQAASEETPNLPVTCLRQQPLRACRVKLQQMQNKRRDRKLNMLRQFLLPCVVRLERIRIYKNLGNHVKNVNVTTHCKNRVRKVSKREKSIQSCQICRKQLQKSSLVAHQRVHSGETPYKCEICSKQFGRLDTLKTHKMIHMTKKPYECDICGRRFVQKINLTLHSRTHLMRPYACKCGRRFWKEAQLLKHSQGTSKKRLRICDYCGKHFRERNNFLIHIRTHTGQKPHECKICTKRFADGSALTRHVRIHTGQKPYSCEVCGKKFAQSGALTVHALTHTGEKKYSCDTCGKKFGLKYYLQRHIRTHTGEKPYACKYCDIRFSDSGSASKHKRIHTGERPHVCDSCGKRFIRRQQLTGHMRIHTGEKPFSCTICKRPFACKYNCLNHERKVHLKSSRNE